MSLKDKIRIIIAVAAVGLVAMAGLWLSGERRSLIDERKQSTQKLLAVPYSVISEQYKLEQQGRLTREQAQQNALEILRVMRYDENNYFWVNDTHPTMIMHPIKPELNGKDLTATKDPTGKALFVEIVQAARDPRGGFVFYKWPKPGRPDPVDKLSFVRTFEPWGWVVGTGVYIEDIDIAWHAYARQAGAVGLLCLAILLVAGTRISRSIAHRVDDMVARMRDAAEGEGDLTQRITVNSNDEIAELARWFNTFMDKLQRLVTEVAGGTHRLASASEEISVTSRQQAGGAELQRERTAEIASSLQLMSETVARVSEHSQQAASASRHAMELATNGGSVVQQTLDRMHKVSASVGETAQKVEELGRRSEQIGQISRVIDDIADQTNLLALNAAIEAARAGEHGRGFAVVADEVRKLAVRSSAATREITDTILGIQQETAELVRAMQESRRQVEGGVESTGQAGQSLIEIIGSSEKAGQVVADIAQAAAEQATTTGEIRDNIERITAIIGENADMAQQSSKAHEELASLALDLQQLVSQFKLEGDRQPSQPQSWQRPPDENLSQYHHPYAG